MERTPRIGCVDWPTSGGRNERGADMRRDRLFAIAAIATLLVCALLIAGCGGDDDDDDATSSGASAQEHRHGGSIVQRRGPAARRCCGNRSRDARAPRSGDAAKQALSTGGEEGEQALSQAASSCESAVDAASCGPGSGRAVEPLRRDQERWIDGASPRRRLGRRRCPWVALWTEPAALAPRGRNQDRREYLSVLCERVAALALAPPRAERDTASAMSQENVET